MGYGRVRKTVIPVAGLGTRFLPATKAVPKVLLPLVDRPALQYIVEEAVESDLNDVLFITGRDQASVLNHFDRMPELESVLENKGDTQRLREVQRLAELASVYAVRQGEPHGLGHAVLCAREHVGRETFTVQLGDDIIDARNPILPTMLSVQERYNGIVLALLEVPRDQISLYGAASVNPERLSVAGSEVVRVAGLVEKPEPEKAPSNLAVIGRYVLPPSIFEYLEKTAPGAGGEIQLTDAIAAAGHAGVPVHGVIFRGRRYDTGDKAEYLRATVQIAADHPELGEEFRTWLHRYVTLEM